MKRNPASKPAARSAAKGRASARRKSKPTAAAASGANGSIAAKLVRVGNSRGVRLPKSVIEQAGLTTEVEITVEKGKVIIRPARKHPRAGWEEAMKKAVAEHGNELTEEDREWLDAPLNSEWDEKEWMW